jgi:hypothetical protein
MIYLLPILLAHGAQLNHNDMFFRLSMVRILLNAADQEKTPLSREPYSAKYSSTGKEYYHGKQEHCSMI